MNGSIHAEAALVGAVDLAAAVHRECKMLDPHFEVVVLAAVGVAEPESGLGLATRDMLLTEAEADDLLGSPIGQKPASTARSIGPSVPR